MHSIAQIHPSMYTTCFVSKKIYTTCIGLLDYWMNFSWQICTLFLSLFLSGCLSLSVSLTLVKTEVNSHGHLA